MNFLNLFGLMIFVSAYLLSLSPISLAIAANNDGKSFDLQFDKIFGKNAERAKANAIRPENQGCNQLVRSIVNSNLPATAGQGIFRPSPKAVVQSSKSASNASLASGVGNFVRIIPASNDMAKLYEKIFALADQTFQYNVTTPGSARAAQSAKAEIRESYYELLRAGHISPTIPLMGEGRGSQLFFHQMQPGSYMGPEASKKLIEASFAISSTLISRKVWARIASKANKYLLSSTIPVYPNGLEPGIFGEPVFLVLQQIALLTNKNADDISLVNNERLAVLMKAQEEQYKIIHEIFGHPVSNLAVDDITNWIAALNWLSKNNDQSLEQLIPGHQEGDLYRLASSNEIEFLLNGGGESQWEFRREINHNLAKFANYDSKEPEEIARRQPLLIQGQEIYDLLGNTNTLVFTGDLPNSTTDTKGMFYAIRGGSAESSIAELFRSMYLETSIPAFEHNSKNPWMGFRLVRIRKQNLIARGVGSN